MIARVAAQEGSTERDFALSALLERYAGIDAPRAAAKAHEADLRGALLAPIYAQWAALDPTGALEALRTVAVHEVTFLAIGMTAPPGPGVGRSQSWRSRVAFDVLYVAASTFAQLSRSVTTRLKTGPPEAERSESAQK